MEILAKSTNCRIIFCNDKTTCAFFRPLMPFLLTWFHGNAILNARNQSNGGETRVISCIASCIVDSLIRNKVIDVLYYSKRDCRFHFEVYSFVLYRHKRKETL